MQMTKDLDWVKNQIVVLNVVGSNPTGYPPKVPEIIEFQGLLLYVSTIRPHLETPETLSVRLQSPDGDNPDGT